MKKSRTYWVLLAVLPFLSCGGGNDDPGQEPKIPTPSAAVLIFPFNNEECTEGNVLSETQSQVTFQWNAAENTDSYTLKLKNLESGTENSTTTTNTQLQLTLDRGTPYAWSVVSKANGTDENATSDTWRFYNAGAATENHAPFPAYDPSPKMGIAVDPGNITLQWKSTDLDGDALTYAIYLDTANPPIALLDESETNSSETMVVPNTVYYWRVVSSDSAGNSSESEIFEFRTNP